MTFEGGVIYFKGKATGSRGVRGKKKKNGRRQRTEEGGKKQGLWSGQGGEGGHIGTVYGRQETKAASFEEKRP